MTDEKNGNDGASGGPDIAKLRDYARSDGVAKRLFQLLSQRQRRRRELVVEVLMRDLEITRPTAVEVFRTLQELGCGKMVLGRGSKPTRFEWHYTMNSVGLAALGQSESLEPMQRSDAEIEGSEAQTAGASGTLPESLAGTTTAGSAEPPLPAGMIKYPFPLRPDVIATLFLPVDLTDDEAERLSYFVNALGRPTKKDLP